MREPGVAAYVLGAIAAGLVLVCVVMGSMLAAYWPDIAGAIRQAWGR